jgi:sugar phosphate isomerase/epimerase
MITRRGLLAAPSLALPALQAANAYSPIFAGQAYVFQQHYARMKEPLDKHFEEIFQSLRIAGYENLELTNAFFAPEYTERTAGLLKRHKLKLPIVYNGGVMHTEEGAEKTISDTLALARRVKKATGTLKWVDVNSNPLPKGAAKSDAELAVQARTLTRLATELSHEKLGLMVHQHAPEMANGAREWRHMIANTDPKLVQICLDVHWVLRGGQDVMTLLKEAAPRLAALHLRNSSNGIWIEEFAGGDIDYKQVAAYLKEVGYKGYLVVELAVEAKTEQTASIESNIRRSLNYAESIFRK